MKRQQICKKNFILIMIKKYYFFALLYIPILNFRLDESIDDDFFYRHCFRLGRSGNSGYVNILHTRLCI